MDDGLDLYLSKDWWDTFYILKLFNVYSILYYEYDICMYNDFKYYSGQRFY